jgi:hypothetical protein
MWSRRSFSLDIVTLVLIISRYTVIVASKTEPNQANTALFPSAQVRSHQPAAKAKLLSFFVPLMIVRAILGIRTNGSVFSCDEPLMTLASSYHRVHKLKHNRLKVFRCICIAWSMGNMGLIIDCSR